MRCWCGGLLTRLLRTGHCAFSPVMQAVNGLRGGGLVLGICNGFQILTNRDCCGRIDAHRAQVHLQTRALRVETTDSHLPSAHERHVLEIPSATWRKLLLRAEELKRLEREIALRSATLRRRRDYGEAIPTDRSRTLQAS